MGFMQSILKSHLTKSWKERPRVWLAAWSQSSGVGIGCGLFGESAASCSMGQSSTMPSQRQIYHRVWSRKEAMGWPHPFLLSQALLRGWSPPLAFQALWFPHPFSFGQGIHIFFLQMEKKMRHRLRWQGKGHRKISFLWGACLKYRLIAWESQRAGCSTGSGRALVPPKRSCRTHRDSWSRKSVSCSYHYRQDWAGKCENNSVIWRNRLYLLCLCFNTGNITCFSSSFHRQRIYLWAS